MNKLLQKIFRNRSTRVLLLLFVALLALIIYFLLHSYYVQLDIHKQKVLSRLDAIANTTATQINGDDLENLLIKYPNKDDIESNEQEVLYSSIHSLLSAVKLKNNLNSDIYTLSYLKKQSSFVFGVSSANDPFYRHEYTHFPEELIELYESGGRIGVYEDENGHWLSAFVPIKNSQGKVIAIIQADSQFDEFIDEARSSILINIVISLAFTLALVFFLFRSVRSILMAEDKLTQDLVLSKHNLEERNRDIMDSIKYAKKIQEAILPAISCMEKILPKSFILFKPRDIVSGDFYWFKEIDEFIIIASVDCTGHGVPGAFMSMIGSVLLEDIVSKKQTTDPNVILDLLHQKVVQALKQDAIDTDSKDGMDIALCVIHKKSNKLAYAGACRPLVIVRRNEVQQIKADCFPIGGTMYDRNNYTAHKVEIQEGDQFYIFSDGYPDQFGGEKGKKYMTIRFRKFLLSISNKTMNEQKILLDNEFNQWKGKEEQVDDVLVIGFQV